MLPLAPASRLIIPSPGPAVPWHLLPISSSSRRTSTGRSHDDVNLLHWVKGVEGDYRFARFNKPIKVRAWAEGEYERHLYDPDWSAAETEELFRLCRAYDLRFIVVHDRYNAVAEEKRRAQQSDRPQDRGAVDAAATAPAVAVKVEDVAMANAPGKEEAKEGSAAPSPSPSLPSSSLWRERTVEELKGRYYSIQVKLMQLHNASDPDLRKHPLFTSAYDEAYERKRKELLALLFRRSLRDVEELSAAVVEHRKTVAQLKRLKKATKELRNGKGAAGGALGGAGGAGVSHKKKKRDGMGSGAQFSPFPIPESQLAPIPSDLLPSVAPLATPLPFLRSAQLGHALSALPPRLLRTVEGELALLQVKKPKEIIPTGPVLELFEQLRSAVMVMRGLEQLCESRESVRDELREAERRKGGHTLGLGNSGGTGSGLGDGRGDGDGRVKKEKKALKKERKDGSGDRDDDGEREKSSSSSSSSHKKKDKRKSSDGDERDSKRRKK